MTKRSRNRLTQLGLLSCHEVAFANHWLAFRDVCQISPLCIFDDLLIEQAIQEEREANWSMKLFYQDAIKPYSVNDPEYPKYLNWGANGLVVKTGFFTLTGDLAHSIQILIQ